MVETRRSSSSSKRALSSPAPPPSNAKRSKASEASSSTNDVQSGPSVENLSPVKESGCEPRDLEPQSPDLLDTGSPKPVDACDADKCEDFGVEGEALVSPLSLGGAAVDAEKSKVAVTALRPKKRLTKLTKSSPKVAWGKLLSQCSQPCNELVTPIQTPHHTQTVRPPSLFARANAPSSCEIDLLEWWLLLLVMDLRKEQMERDGKQILS